MADLQFLWRHREVPTNARRVVIVWTKRLLYAWGLIRLLARPYALRWRGAHIGRVVCVGQVKLGGDRRLLSIGDFSSIGRSEIALHERVSIGRCVVVNDGAVILTASHDVRDAGWRHVTAPVVIEDYAWIATNAIICPGVTIGRGAVVGAGAVVRKDVQPYGIAIGNPAALVGSRPTLEFAYHPSLLNAPFEAWIGKRHPDVA